MIQSINIMKVVNNRYQYIAAASATLSLITSGMHNGWPSPSIPKLLNGSHLHVTNEESSWIAVMPLIASIFGVMLSVALLNSIGRKNTILLSGIPNIVSWLMITFSSNLELMFLARFLAGLANGITCTAIPLYLGEIADPSIRGFFGVTCTVSLNLGCLLINGLGVYLSIFTTALISTLLPLLFLVTFYFMPKSPYYLIMKDRFYDAKKTLKLLKDVEDIDPDFNRIINSVKEDTSDTSQFCDLFTVASNRKALLIMIGLYTVQQLSGISPITFYTQIILQQTDQNISAELTTVIYYVVQFIMSCVSSLIMDIAGRRLLMLISVTGTMLALMAEGIYVYLQSNTTVDVTYFNYVAVIALIAFIICYSIALSSVPMLMVGELFPVNVKVFAICVANIYYCIIATAAAKFFQITKDHFGMYVPFICFSICCFLGILFVIICLPETKGKTLEEVQDELKGIKRVDPN